MGDGTVQRKGGRKRKRRFGGWGQGGVENGMYSFMYVELEMSDGFMGGEVRLAVCCPLPTKLGEGWGAVHRLRGLTHWRARLKSVHAVEGGEGGSRSPR